MKLQILSKPKADFNKLDSAGGYHSHSIAAAGVSLPGHVLSEDDILSIENQEESEADRQQRVYEKVAKLLSKEELASLKQKLSGELKLVMIH